MTIPKFSLGGEVAIVTGGRRGIGRSIALALAEAGADVAVCDLVVENGQLEDVAEEIRSLGRRSLAIQVDTSRKTEVENMVKEVMKEFGAIDILINNAGTSVHGQILDLPEDEWDKVVNVNLKGYFLCAQAVGKRMVERKKGNIICTASQYAFKAVSGMGVYCITKAGVVMLTRVLARELGSYGIRANAIAPGLVKTDLSRNEWENPENRKQREAAVPLGRIAETSDLVGMVLFLASDASNYVTGHTIVVDGGELA
jgi:NAD(P)-dependent dehydrogenase (short-subunit alcohol dehydrogenase family)